VADPRVRWLLVLAAVLAGLRFAVVPWMQQQGEQRQQLEVLTQRLDRSVSVVQNAEAMQAARGKVVEVTEAARAPFPVVDDKDRFRLDSQRTLAGIAQRGGVSVTLFDWVLDGEAAQAGMAYGRVNASLAGPLDSLVAVHGAIEAAMPYAAVREVKLDLGRVLKPGLGKDPGTLALVMDLYYRPASTPEPAAATAPATAASAPGTGGRP
jgi:hypothetical protein